MERFTKIIVLAFVALVALDSFGAKAQTTTTESATTTTIKPATTTTKPVDTTTTATTATTATTGTTTATTTATTTKAATTTAPHGGSPSLAQAWSQLVALVMALVLLAA